MISMLDGKLNEWGRTQPWTITKGVRDSKGVLTYALILWPDSTSGEYFADEQDPTTGAVNAWHATYVGNVKRTITQQRVTRDANGGIVAQPQLVIAE
ncbi:hypothetical protein LGN21_04525 [Burkholderia cepacia]|uniref:hypothetical protein n=1 Tax=Burkholderia cepacia TaxID=292 RepID=UPI001CF274F4|nr:hypothetical protein [Burkholderia cepacia]MCA8278846.1 hypothetical protein [Burkholderia cepacia]